MPHEKFRRFEEQVSPLLQSAYNLAEWLTRSREEAEDIVQEAFLKAFSAFERFRSEDAKPWLLAIVRNTAMTGSSEIETRRPPSTSTKHLSIRLSVRLTRKKDC
jgi:RNA polymerase sigma factor (sigma-70 family)